MRKTTWLLVAIVLLTGCGESLESMKARRDELRDRVQKLRMEIIAIERAPDSPAFYESFFTEEELAEGYITMTNRRLDELEELQPRLEEVQEKIERELRR